MGAHPFVALLVLISRLLVLIRSALSSVSVLVHQGFGLRRVDCGTWRVCSHTRPSTCASSSGDFGLLLSTLALRTDVTRALLLFENLSLGVLSFELGVFSGILLRLRAIVSAVSFLLAVKA